MQKGDTIMEDFAKRLQQLRESQKPIKSRVVVSHLCGLDSGAVRQYERGERKPTMDALIALADYFDVSIDYLVGRENFR